jgi:hypothetical protein
VLFGGDEDVDYLLCNVCGELVGKQSRESRVGGDGLPAPPATTILTILSDGFVLANVYR